MAKVIGRKVLPTDINEEYILEQLGVVCIVVPRKLNPYLVARRLVQAARPCPHHHFLYELVSRVTTPKLPMPGGGTPTPAPAPLPGLELFHAAAE